MNNEELEKKIENLLHKEIEYVVVCGSSVKNVCIEHIADALIAAGIGDVEESENKATAAELVAQVSASTAIEKIAEWKHRAEVAERALRNRARKFVDLQGYPTWDIATLADEIVVPDDLKQAEKELAEERKDD